MNITEDLVMENGSTHPESHGQQFMCSAASSGLVQQFNVDGNGSPSDCTIHQLQDVRSSEKQNAVDTLYNFEVNCSQNGIPLMDQSDMRKMESMDEIHLLENANVARSDQIVNKASMVDNSTIVSLESIVAETGDITVNDMENVITRKRSLGDLEVRATEDGSDNGSEAHICYQCGKGFKEISSLNGHMGSHRREEYKCIRMISKQSIPVEASQKEAARALKHFWGPSKALVEMSMAHAWNPKYGTDTIDLSANVTLSSDAHSSGETVEMGEAADVLTTLVDRIHKKNVTVPLPRSDEGIILCAICNKTFSSYQALGGHMSIHSKPKNSMFGDSIGTSSDSGEQCTWKYVCRKCNERFPTQKSLGGHTRKHWRETFKMTSSADEKNLDPPVPLPHETMESSGPVVLPTDEGMQLPAVLLIASDNVQPTRMELAVTNPNVHQLLPLDFDASQKQQHANRLSNETEKPSGVPKTLVDTEATLPAPMMIPPSKRCLPDLNMTPDETDDDDEP